MTTFFLSTFRCLLRVTLDAHHRPRQVRQLETGHGIYFGLTRGRGRVFAVARNLDIDKRVQDPRFPINAVQVLPRPWHGRWGPTLTVDGASDLHQIRHHDGLLWLVNGQAPEFLAADPRTGKRVGAVTLADFVPAELRHDAPPDHPGDRYHFNSLHFARGRLFALAHNWDHGSFVLEFAYPNSRQFLAGPCLLRVYTGMGRQSHDVFFHGGRLYVLDSGGGRLVCSDGRALHLGGAERAGYLRGLAVGQQFFYVAQGSFSDAREGRLTGPSWISVVDRPSFRVVATVEVGPFGNTCDLLLLSERDRSD